MQMSGSPISDDVISGRFAGNLADVLKKLLPDHGFVIAYVNGRPSRVVFTGKGSGKPPSGLGLGYPPDIDLPGGYFDPNTGTMPDLML